MARTIAEELKQTRPFRSASQEAAVALLRTSHLLRRKVEALVGTEGLTSQQYNVLRILRGARSPLPTMEISERMIETACGITRLITTLEEKGFVRREQWPGDRRQFLCQITPAGARVLERLDAPMDDLDDFLLTGIPPEQIETLLDVLARIRERITPD
jgi:MarR family 2-MHQ and catechol resistance regulon transcriptional repressor